MENDRKEVVKGSRLKVLLYVYMRDVDVQGNIFWAGYGMHCYPDRTPELIVDSVGNDYVLVKVDGIEDRRYYLDNKQKDECTEVVSN